MTAYSQPGFFEFGGIAMDWTDSLMPVTPGLKSKIQTPNPEPRTPNPEPRALNPETVPQTLNLERRALEPGMSVCICERRRVFLRCACNAPQ